MTGFVLYHKRSQPTGAVIASALDVPHGLSLPAFRTDWLIRWGNRGGNATGNPIINTARAIANASDKLGSLQTLRDAGVCVPDWSTSPEELEFPFLGRRIHHARGTDVVLCLQKGDYKRKSRDYYVKYIPTVREFRVHVVAGEVIRVQGKFLDKPELALPWLRNFENGYRFRAPKKRVHSKRLSAATQAVAALGLDFGAVDILIGDDGETYVLEVNTAPSCSPLTAAGYITAFAKMLGIDTDTIEYDRLGLLSGNGEEHDTDDEVEGEDFEESQAEAAESFDLDDLAEYVMRRDGLHWDRNRGLIYERARALQLERQGETGPALADPWKIVKEV